MYGNAFLGGIIRYGIKKIPTNRTNSNWFYCTIGYRCCYNGQCVGLASCPHFGGCRSWLLGGGCVCFNFNLYFFSLVCVGFGLSSVKLGWVSYGVVEVGVCSECFALCCSNQFEFPQLNHVASLSDLAVCEGVDFWCWWGCNWWECFW